MGKKVLRKLDAHTREEIAEAAYRYAEERIRKENGGTSFFTESEKFKKLSDRVYLALYSPSERSRMKRLPEGWLPYTCELRVAVKSQRREGSEIVTLRFSRKVLVPFTHYGWNESVKLEGPIADEIAALIKQDRQNRDTLNSAVQKTRHFMASYRSTKALIEAWPEVCRIMPKGYFYVEEVKALVMQSAELNAALGLA